MSQKEVFSHVQTGYLRSESSLFILSNDDVHTDVFCQLTPPYLGAMRGFSIKKHNIDESLFPDGTDFNVIGPLGYGLCTCSKI